MNVLLTTGNNAIVFEDILKQDLRRDITIGDNNLLSDCILCSCIADVNMDGKNEILLGTYKQEVLIFSYRDNEWKMIDKKLFDAPIHSICYIDLVGDGVKMLVILTQKSVHIMQVMSLMNGSSESLFPEKFFIFIKIEVDNFKMLFYD